jgi:hypothetical protein
VALERRHAGNQEGEEEVGRLLATLHLQGGDPQKNLLHVRRRARKSGTPIIPLGSARLKGRQVDMVFILL